VSVSEFPLNKLYHVLLNDFIYSRTIIEKNWFGEDSCNLWKTFV
jgi:hypothetical protein